jgi:hypothetical protein
MLSPDCYILGPDQTYVFAFIPKSACTNWKCLMRHEYGFENYLNPALAHDRKNGGLRFVSDLENPWSVLLDRNCPKYTCVRNPYSRLLSAYLNKVEPFVKGAVPDQLRKGHLKIFTAMDEFRSMVLPDKEAVDFECFITWLDLALTKDPFVKNPHWIPQTQIIGTGQIQFDYIARFENLEDDAAELLSRIGCKAAFPSQKAVKFPPTEASRKTRQYYTPASVEMVRRIYADDFAYLGYDPEKHPLAA